jgi:hypothetical protein
MEYLEIGQIVNTQGLKGEVRIYPYTDDAKRFDELKKIYVEIDNTKIRLDIKSVRYYKNLVIAKFNNIDTIEDAMKYKGKYIFIDEEDKINVAYADLRWSVFSTWGDNGKKFDNLKNNVFPFIKTLHGDKVTSFAKYMEMRSLRYIAGIRFLYSLCFGRIHRMKVAKSLSLRICPRRVWLFRLTAYKHCCLSGKYQYWV